MLAAIVALLGGLTVSSAYVMPAVGNSSFATRSPPVQVTTRERVARNFDDEVNDFSWVKRWAAIGDSFTAGIGSGSPQGKLLDEAWGCSRYTYAWPEIVNHALGPSVQRGGYQFKACSGARTGQIIEQANNLDGNLDVVMMTAGGNDLCLSSIIKECIFLPYGGESPCTEALETAERNIRTILKPNIRLILNALDNKIKQDGVLVYMGYAPFFDVANEDCADSSKQSWNYHLTFWHWFQTPLRLTKARRQRFNALVNSVNEAIKEVVEEEDEDGNHPYRLVYGDWSGWPEIVDGQMCSAKGDGKYPDPKQPNLHFFKPDTYNGPAPPRDWLRRRADENITSSDMDAETEEAHAQMFYEPELFRSSNPQVEALYLLTKRTGAAAANCPGDGGVGQILGMGLPDSFLSNFHPNELGHETIAAAALDNLIRGRGKVLGKDSCPLPPVKSLHCFNKPGKGERNKAFVGWTRMDEAREQFCSKLKPPANTKNWQRSMKFFETTPEEVEFTVTLYNDAMSFDRDDCREAFGVIIHNCDTGGPSNPMNWKYGGVRWDGDYEFRIQPMGRPRELIMRTDGECNSHYNFFYSTYHMSGKGWATHDWGDSKNGILAQIKSCTKKLKNVHFRYCRTDDDCDGYDWLLSFDTNIWVRKRCFDNLKVQAAAGGYTHKYHHQWGVHGCAGKD